MHNLHMWLRSAYYNLAGHGLVTHDLARRKMSALTGSDACVLSYAKQTAIKTNK